MYRGAKLKHLRNERGLTQKDLARMLEITQSHLSRFENGHIHPRTELLERWCAFFGITVQELDEMCAKEPDSGWKPFLTRSAMKRGPHR